MSSEYITVTVNSVGRIQELIGEKMVEVKLEAHAHTLRDLIEKMSIIEGDSLRRMIRKGETTELYIQVLVNGLDVDFLQKLETPLKEGDRVDLLPLISGGGSYACVRSKIGL